MQCPAKGGSDFFNYKKTHSIVLLGVCNGKYEFIMVDIGDSGRQSDGSVYNNSSTGYCIDNNILNFPFPKQVKNSQEVLPYVFLGDDAFGLKPNLLKPYPGQNLQIQERIFNYGLSRARRIIENTFGIAASRFRIFRRPIIAKVDTVKAITKAVVALHNLLMASRVQEEPYNYCPFDYVDQEVKGKFKQGEWRNDSKNLGMLLMGRCGSNNFSSSAKEMRSRFKNYFNSDAGSVSWQIDLGESR